MRCPKCNYLSTKVIDSRAIENQDAIRRRRVCTDCDYRFSTIERRVSAELIVAKKDGSKELYNRTKLKKAILLSFAKRPVSPDTIDIALADLESQRSQKGKVIRSERIGKDVLQFLKHTDPVAYIRFASVYMKFDTLEDFQKAMQEA